MLIKLISAALFALIIFQSWTNIQEVRLVKEQKNAQLFAPIKSYLSSYIKDIEGNDSQIVFSKFRTKTIIPGRNIIGEFDLSYDQAKENKTRLSKALFKGSVELTSIDGVEWVASLQDIQNKNLKIQKIDFDEPMYVQSSK